MSKVNELSIIVEELRKCGEKLRCFSEDLTDLFSSTVKDEKQAVISSNCSDETVKKNNSELPKEKTLTLEDVRGVLADKSKDGKTAEVKALITSFGADKLSSVNPSDYAELLKKAEVL